MLLLVLLHLPYPLAQYLTQINYTVFHYHTTLSSVHKVRQNHYRPFLFKYFKILVATCS